MAYDDFIRDQILLQFRQYGRTYEQAGHRLIDDLIGMGSDPETVRAAVSRIVEGLQDEASRIRLLDRPNGVRDPYYDHLESQAREADWFPGRTDQDHHWPYLKSRWQGTSLQPVTDALDEESQKITSHLANPNVPGLQKKGLILGHVQSGKTANYTAVMASAADAGYRLFIVLAGMHNGLRRQTQERLDNDLVNDYWKPLTTNEQDFGVVTNDTALFQSRNIRILAVVKKNSARLRRLRDWLKDVPLDYRRKCPALLIDDEADQATPNTRAEKNELSKMNELVRQIRKELPTSTYLAYTATPFATVLLDPDDAEELYPSDFILDLPRPPDYFGPARLFGRDPVNAEDEPELGLDMIRHVPDGEAQGLRPPTPKDERHGWAAPLPSSLRTAIEWFLISTAARRARAATTPHASMLIHTTHYVDGHFAQRAEVDAFLDQFSLQDHHEELLQLWREETSRVDPSEFGEPALNWAAVQAQLPTVLEDTRTVVDNAQSSERVTYGRRDENGYEIPETVIAIGGNTLSRGLTLEGLCVSYFVRFANTYDTLLQMGRWFGYRRGYPDLARLWTTEMLADNFRFLATVEEEIRQDIQTYTDTPITPRHLGLRIRTHPGRLAVTSRAKMAHARPQRVGYGSTRRQTFIFEETDEGILESNIDATRDLVDRCLRESSTQSYNGPRAVFTDLDPDVVMQFIEAYHFHEDHAELQPELINGWIRERRNLGRPSEWNVVLMSSSTTHLTVGNRSVHLGALDVGLDQEVNTFSRAPLAKHPPGRADIKSLISRKDRLADLDVPESDKPTPDSDRELAALRRRLAPSTGALLIYPISKYSEPKPLARPVRDPRRSMEAPQHLIGVGLVFPHDETTTDPTYVAVQPDWEAEDPVEEVELPTDTEGNARIDGTLAT